MVIEVLVIDDELARIAYKRDDFLERWRLAAPGDRFGSTVAFTFTSGQRAEGDFIRNDVSQALAFLESSVDKWALVLLDMQFDHGQLVNDEPVESDPRFGLDIQAAIETRWPRLPIVHFTAQRQADLGRQDQHYLSKLDGTAEELRMLLAERGCLTWEQRKHLLGIPKDIVASSISMIRAYATALRLARVDTPIMIQGETGTGKEHLAKYVHSVSRRATGPLVDIQISAIPPGLYESQLFGHEKGSFTGATKPFVGFFGRAKGGTIFMDEIGALPADLQAKLLRAIGERSYLPVGGTHPQQLDCTIVAATQDDLEAIGFRKDLLARFSPVTLPPLRERQEEIVHFAEHFLRHAMQTNGKRGIQFSTEALRMLESHRFPDNIRGLSRVVENAVLQLSSHSVIQPDHLLLAARKPLEEAPAAAVQRPARSASTHDEPGLASTIENLGRIRPAADRSGLKGTLTALEEGTASLKRELAMAALELCRHPVSGKLRIQPAMQLLADDAQLTAMNAKRMLNRLLGRKQDEQLDLVEIESLVQARKCVPVR